MATINSITINGQSVSFKYGLTITDILSKDINTGILVIPQTNKLDIEPLDEVVITFEVTKVITMVVAQINAKVINFEGSKKYSYTLGLASTTLKLQRIVLPSRTITNSLDGSADKTIYKVIQEFVEIYAPDYTISSTLQSKTASVTCPEFSWNRPTLFEVFNDLLSVIGCVVTVTGSSTISLLDLYDKNNTIDETKLSSYEINRNAAEYASAVEIQASNVYDTNTNGTGEFVSVRTTEQAFLTTGNQQIVLQKPIFQIKKVTAQILLVGSNKTIVQNIDITDRVVEQTVYDTFYNSNAAGFLADTSTKKYRRNYVVFKQGGNTIFNLDYKEATWIPYTNGNSSIVNVLYWQLENGFFPNKNLFNANDYNGFLSKKILFFVEYISTDDITFRVLKDTPIRNQSVLINGQTTAEVYARSLGKQQQEFVNRIGNEELTITGRYLTYNEIPVANDYLDEYILTSREVVFNDGFYNFKGMMSKYYAKDNMFAGINTSKRYTEIASGSRALLSNHLNENIFFLSTTNGLSNPVGINNYLLQFGKVNEKIQGAIVQTIPTQEMTFPFLHIQSSRFLMEGTAHWVGNSIIYNIRMADNANVALSIETDFRLLGEDVQSMRKNPYVNNLGRFYAIAVRLYKKNGIRNLAIDNATFPLTDSTTLGIQNFIKGTDAVAKLPVVSLTETYDYPALNNTVTYNRIDETKKVYNFLNTGQFVTGGLEDYKKRYKDNREITSETIQFHFRKSPNAFFTDKFLEYNPFIYTGTTDLSFKIAYSTTLTYNDLDTDYKGTIVNNNTDVKITIAGNQIYIEPTVAGQTWWNANFFNMVSWAICDANGKIIVARNGTLGQRLSLNSIKIV
jgi:hypothetical protein